MSAWPIPKGWWSESGLDRWCDFRQFRGVQKPFLPLLAPDLFTILMANQVASAKTFLDFTLSSVRAKKIVNQVGFVSNQVIEERMKRLFVTVLVGIFCTDHCPRGRDSN